METVVRISTIIHGMFSLICEKIPAEMKRQKKISKGVYSTQKASENTQ